MLFNDEGEEGVEITEPEEETEEVVETETEEPKEEKPKETLDQKEARLLRQLEQTRKKLGKDTVEPEKKPKSEGLDYGQKAFLVANGIKDAKEISFIQKELKGSGLELDELLENGYFKDKFTTFQALNKTADATPKGKRGGGVATDSVEYWASKPIAEVPQEMRQAVVNHRLKKETSSGVFYNS
jgi:hypothetical protein